MNIIRLIVGGVILSLTVGCSLSGTKGPDASDSNDSDDASVVAAIVAAQLEAQKEAERQDSIRQDSIRRDSIERHTLVEFDVTDFLKRRGDDVDVINWESSLSKLGFTKGKRKKIGEGEDYGEFVETYRTVYTCESRAGNIVIEYVDTQFKLFNDFSWKIRFENPEQKEKFIRSFYSLGYKKASTDRNLEGKVYRYVAQIGNNLCVRIYWHIYDDYIVSGLSTC